MLGEIIVDGVKYFYCKKQITNAENGENVHLKPITIHMPFEVTPTKNSNR